MQCPILRHRPTTPTAHRVCDQYNACHASPPSISHQNKVLPSRHYVQMAEELEVVYKVINKTLCAHVSAQWVRGSERGSVEGVRDSYSKPAEIVEVQGDTVQKVYRPPWRLKGLPCRLVVLLVSRSASATAFFLSLLFLARGGSEWRCPSSLTAVPFCQVKQR